MWRGSADNGTPRARALRAAACDACFWLLAACVAAADGVGRLLAVAFTVYFDPFGLSAAPIAFRGRCAYEAFTVAAARTERERRQVAWFYRWHAAPSFEDWVACGRRFGLATPPPHVLRARAPGAADLYVAVRLEGFGGGEALPAWAAPRAPAPQRQAVRCVASAPCAGRRKGPARPALAWGGRGPQAEASELFAAFFGGAAGGAGAVLGPVPLGGLLPASLLRDAERARAVAPGARGLAAWALDGLLSARVLRAAAGAEPDPDSAGEGPSRRAEAASDR